MATISFSVSFLYGKFFIHYFIISFFCGIFFIYYLILALAYLILCFILLWQVFHSFFHSSVAYFSFIISFLPWLISFKIFHSSVAHFSFIISFLPWHLLVYLEFDGINLKSMTFIWLNFHIWIPIMSYYGLKYKQI